MLRVIFLLMTIIIIMGCVCQARHRKLDWNNRQVI